MSHWRLFHSGQIPDGVWSLLAGSELVIGARCWPGDERNTLLQTEVRVTDRGEVAKAPIIDQVRVLYPDVDTSLKPRSNHLGSSAKFELHPCSPDMFWIYICSENLAFNNLSMSPIGGMTQIT